MEVKAGTLSIRSDPKDGQSAWDWGLQQTINQPIKKGEFLVLTVIGRSPNGGKSTLCFELNKPPHSKNINRVVTWGPEFTMVRVTGIASDDYAAGGSQISFHLGHLAADFEFKQIKLESYGLNPSNRPKDVVDPYDGQPNPSSWRADAEKRIEQIRKGDVAIEVRRNGKPVKGASVSLSQVQHGFGFGSAVVASKLLGKSPDDIRYQKEVARLFNIVVFENDLKWGVAESMAEDAEKALPWLEARKMKVRGHNLVWGSVKWAKPLEGLNKEDTIKAIENRVANTVKRFKGKVYTWDVVNEAATETEIWERIGWDQFPRTFKLAEQADPNLLLTYNDYNISNQSGGDRQYQTIKKRVKFLLDSGAKVDILGDQAHMAMPLTPISKVLDIWSDFAKFGRPIEITEFDAAIQDDQIHRQYVADYLTAAFSHPAVQNFLMWGFWENSHWLAKEGGAMFRADWSKRPAQEAYENLVLQKWWTKTKGITGSSGNYLTRAFFGRHKVTVTSGKSVKVLEIELKKGSVGKVVVNL